MSTRPAFPSRAKGPDAARADLCIVGGAGHVGLPLGLVFAQEGRRVLLYDRNAEALRTIMDGRMPFLEQGAEPLLQRALAQGLLEVTSEASAIRGVPVVIVTIGTPVDEFLNPELRVFTELLDDCGPYLTSEQLFVLRSTVVPGTIQWLSSQLDHRGIGAKLAYCPERIVQGFAIRELRELPQIVSGTSEKALQEASALFGSIASELVVLSPLEAEFAKIFCNVYRYIDFAVANQFYMIADAAGVDYARVREGCRQGYERMKQLPTAGFSAGPCLFKDTMLLAAYSRNQFQLGHAAMMVNEGLVMHIADRLQRSYDLENTRVGLLGMAFKSDIDDPRASLSYKMKKLLSTRCREVLTTDPYVDDASLVPLEAVVASSDVLVLCTPHTLYRDLDLGGTPVIDVWGFLGPRTADSPLAGRVPV